MTKKEVVPRKLEETPSSDHIKNFLKATVSAFPVVGGPLSSLMNDYLPTKKRERFLLFVEGLEENLEEFREELNKEIIISEEFGYLFEQTIKSVLENYHEEKLKSLMALLVNSLKQSEYKADKTEYYLKKIETLTPLHLSMLRFLYDPERCLRESEIDPVKVKDMDFTKTMIEYFKDFDGVDSMVLVGVFNDLHQMDFTKEDKGYFGRNAAPRGIQAVSGHLTPLAKDFVKYCTLEVS